MADLHRAAVKLMESLTMEEVCERSIREACKITGAVHGSVYWWVGDRLKKMYNNGPVETHIIPRKNGNTYAVFRSRKMRILSISEVGKIHSYLKATNSKTFVLLPLFYAKKSLGVLTLHLDKDIDKVHIDKPSFKLLGSLVTLAIRNVQLFEQKEEALRQRELFMSLASHELKTPLSVLIMTLQLYKRNEAQDKPAPQDWFEKLERNTGRLRMITNDLFSTNQLVSGKFSLNKKQVAITDLLLSILNEMELIYKHQFRFYNRLENKDLEVSVDPEKLSIVLTNIIGNAAKYSPRESTISVHIKNSEDGVVIEVQDQGEGISKQDLKYIFDRFYQGENKKSGLGLGLYLAQRITISHGGEIVMKSAKGKGTRVKIVLPVPKS